MTTITTSNIRPTTTGVRGGFDVDVTVDGIEGEATVCVDEINGGYCVYGNSPDMWLSGNLCHLTRDVIVEINREVCAAAAMLAAEQQQTDDKNAVSAAVDRH